MTDSILEEYGRRSRDPIELDQFYSKVPIDIWHQILGARMHYHHGIWCSDESWEAALDNAVVSLAQHLEPGTSILDLGCGWGGPASLLEERYGCRVLGVTVSQSQATYCASRGLNVHCADLEHAIPQGTWSVGLWMESLEHLKRPEWALSELRSRCDKLVIRINTCETGSQRLFGGSMPMHPTRYYLKALASTGWHVIHASNRRSESLRSPVEWMDRLRKVLINRPDDNHLQALWDYSNWFSTNPSAYSVFPLMDIVAEIKKE